MKPNLLRVAGWIATILPAFMLTMSGCMKLLIARGGASTDQMARQLTDLGWSPALLVPLAILELTIVVLYLLPRISFVGAVLATGYLGGAVAAHVRVGDPFFAPVVIGVLVWAGWLLRHPQVLQLLWSGQQGRHTPLLPVLLLLVASPALAQDTPPADKDKKPEEPKKRRSLPSLSPNISYYLPVSARARSAFGSSLVNIGLGGGSRRGISGRESLRPDFSLINGRTSDSRILLAPIGLAYQRTLSDSENFHPYAGFSANFYLADIRSSRAGFAVGSGIRSTVGGTVFLGAHYQRAFLQARYCQMGNLSGFNLSGLNLNVGVRF
jgi:hypothetical protein